MAKKSSFNFFKNFKTRRDWQPKGAQRNKICWPIVTPQARRTILSWYNLVRANYARKRKLF